jgi:AraC-like DNA-binding protein
MSTTDVPPSQALDYYATAMQEALIPMSVQCPSRSHFHAAAESTRLGRLDLLRMVGSAHRVVRGPAELARSERRLFNLLLNRLAPWQLVQRGLSHVRAGDAIVIDSAHAHELEVGTYEFINVAMTEDFVDQWLPDPSLLTARRLDRDGRWSAPLTRFVAQLTPEYMAWRCPLPEEVIVNQLGALLMLAAGDLQPDERDPSPSELALRERIVDRLHERLTEVDLTASDVAGSLGLEERTLHVVLAANGETFAAVLLRLRIEAADRLDAAPRGARLYPDALARSVGFMDAKRLASARRNLAGTR